MSKKNPTTFQATKDIQVNKVRKGLLTAAKAMRVSYHFPLASLSMDFPFEIGLVASA